MASSAGQQATSASLANAQKQRRSRHIHPSSSSRTAQGPAPSSSPSPSTIAHGIHQPVHFQIDSPLPSHQRLPSGASFFPSSSSPSVVDQHLHLSPRQLMAAQQHFGRPAFLPAQHHAQHQGMAQAKQEDDLGSLAASMWQPDEYDSFLQSFVNGHDSTLLVGQGADEIADSSMDYDSTALSSIPGSHDASSYFSSASDTGASHNTFHDFVYGAHNFPTPPESDLGNGSQMGGRSASQSMLSGHSPSSLDASLDAESIIGGYASSLLGSDASPSSVLAQDPSASLEDSMQIPLALLQSAAGLAPTGFPATSSSWDPSFLVPSTATQGSNPSAPSAAPSAVPMTPLAAPANSNTVATVSATAKAKPKAEVRKRSAAEMGSDSATMNKPTKASLKAAASTGGPASKKAKGDAEPAARIAPAPPKSFQAAFSAARPRSKLPHMEVGSNATALAAIERLKAKKVREAEEAAEAQRLKEIKEASSSASSSSSPASRSDGSDKPELTPQMRQQKKVAHNAIERRYRNNINDRIAALRNAVPALRELRPRKTASGRKSRKAQQEEDLVDGVPAATKLNKATILGKATDYIKYLKGRELRLASEVAGLRELVRSLEGGEELLELWEAEMDLVVAEQEAAAADAAAKEEDDLSLSLDGDDGDGNEDEDEDVDEDEDSAAAAHGSANPIVASSRRPSRGGRGSKLALTPSRYMLATFLGVSLLGGGAEFAIDSSGSDASVPVSRPSAGGLVIGASHQLLKRSTSYLSPSAPIVQEVHHLDRVPTHALLFEIIRNVSLGICFLLLIWPLLARYASRWTPAGRPSSNRVRRRAAELSAKKRREMLLSLGKPQVAPSGVDQALRKFVDAPQSSISASWGIVIEATSLVISTYLGRRRSRFSGDHQSLAVWVRLLEVETSLEGLAQPAFLLRLHTALKLANLCHGLKDVSPSSSDAILSPARVHGTLALAFAKLGDGIELAQNAADSHWESAKAAVATVNEDEGEAESAEAESSADDAQSSSGESDIDETRTISSAEDTHQPAAKTPFTKRLSTDGWVESVLKLDLDDALQLLSSPQMVSAGLDNACAGFGEESKKYRLSPLIAIADSLYMRQLADVWVSLFSSLVKGTCPASPDLLVASHLDNGEMDAFDASPCSSPAPMREFCHHHANSHLDLDIITDPESKAKMNARIAKLAATAPQGTASWTLSRVALATWALMLGNVNTARGIASLLPASSSGEQRDTAATFALRRLLSAGSAYAAAGNETSGSSSCPTSDATDAMASSVLGWLHFLRLFSALRENHRVLDAHPSTSRHGLPALLESFETQRSMLVSQTLDLRRTLHAARSIGLEAAEMLSTKTLVQLEEETDELVDILSAVGRKAAGMQLVLPIEGSTGEKEREKALRAFAWIAASPGAGAAGTVEEDSGVEL